MAVGIEKLKARLEKAEAARKKAIRQSQLIATKLGRQERRDDTRRKVIDGAHVQIAALTDPEIAALLKALRSEYLVRDDDRALFGMPPLSDAEKAARGIAPPGTKRRRSAKVEDGEADMPVAAEATEIRLDPAAMPFVREDIRESEAA